MSKQKQKTSESRNWAGMRTMGSMRESLIGISTMRQAIGITISAATSLSVPCLFIPKDIRTMPLGKTQNKSSLVLVEKSNAPR